MESMIGIHHAYFYQHFAEHQRCEGHRYCQLARIYLEEGRALPRICGQARGFIKYLRASICARTQFTEPPSATSRVRPKLLRLQTLQGLSFRARICPAVEGELDRLRNVEDLAKMKSVQHEAMEDRKQNEVVR